MTREGPLSVRVVNRQGGRITDLLNARVENMSWKLNDYGEARIIMPTSDESLKKVELVRTEIQIWHEDDLAWWGVPWRIRGNAESTEIGCDGLLSYFERRYISYTSLNYEDIDQFDIAWNVLNHAQTGDYNQLHISAGAFGKSGVLRYRLYKREEHENIFDALKEWPDLDNGFDFDLRVFGSGRREVMLYHPRKGVVRPNMVLEWGRNIANFTHSEDALELANHVYATGGQANNVKFEENYLDVASAGVYGRMHAVVSEGSRLDPNWLRARAVKAVARRKQPSIVPNITVKNDPVQIFKVLEVGDTVPVRIDHGRVQVDGNYRVVSITWTPDETLRLGLEEAV